MATRQRRWRRSWYALLGNDRFEHSAGNTDIFQRRQLLVQIFRICKQSVRKKSGIEFVRGRRLLTSFWPLGVEVV